MTVRTASVAERRTRLARRHHLAAESRASTPLEVASALVGLHGTDPAAVHLSAAARMREPDVAAVEQAIYDDRVLVRFLGMRRTVFVLPVDLVPVVHAACTRAISVAQRRLAVRLIEQSGIAADGASWLAETEAAAMAALQRRGIAGAAQLAKDEPRLASKVVLAAGKPYEGTQSIGSRVLLLLGADLRAVRARPRGGWTSGQFEWAPMSAWLPDGLPELTVQDASVALARRWLGAYGPATVADLRWWTGWGVAQTRKALAEIGPVEVDLHGEPGIALPGDDEPAAPVEPWAALLPGLDPTVMGWSGPGRGFFLGPHAVALFDRNGNAGPTVWWDGRIVGGWTQRAGGEIAVRLLEDVGAQAAAAVDAEADRLWHWLGDVRITPRFHTPLERELTG